VSPQSMLSTRSSSKPRPTAPARNRNCCLPVIRASQAQATPNTLYTADAGYHSESNLKALAEKQINALIADNGMRQRDERFKDQGKHKARSPIPSTTRRIRRKPPSVTGRRTLRSTRKPASASVRPASRSTATARTASTTATSPPNTAARCATACPANNGTNACAHRRRRKSGKSPSSRGKANATEESHTDRMKRAIDSEEGRARYGRRFATVEPVFGNLRHNKRLDRFTLRGQKKVDTQWKLYCLVHNIEKLAHHGFGQ
jgi:hypothetical protein